MFNVFMANGKRKAKNQSRSISAIWGMNKSFQGTYQEKRGILFTYVIFISNYIFFFQNSEQHISLVELGLKMGEP